MKRTVVLISLVIALAVMVTPVHAQGNDAKPVCTESNTWLDSILGKCVVIDTDSAINTSTGTTPHVQPDTSKDPEESFPTMDHCNTMQKLFGLCKD